MSEVMMIPAIEACARAGHQAVLMYWKATSEMRQVAGWPLSGWSEFPAWSSFRVWLVGMAQSVVDGGGPAQVHLSLLRSKARARWRHGSEWNLNRKTSPWMVPYDHLDRRMKRAYEIYAAVVLIMARALGLVDPTEPDVRQEEVP